MPNSKISALTGATTPLAGTEELPIVQSGATRKVSVANLTAGRSISASAATISGDLTVDTSTLKVDSTNNRVGVGITTPAAPLDVATAAGRVFTTSSGLANLLSSVNTANNAYIDLFIEGANIKFYIAGVKKASVDSTGDITLDAGNLIIGTSGKGIDFSVTSQAAGMTSELLADYEEGTWTPTLNPATGTITGQTTSGSYIKVGKMVLCQFKTLITGGTVTNIATISGFPFTAENANPTAGGICRENVVTGLTWNVVGISNATTFDLIRYDGTNFCANNYGWAGSIVYRTAS